MKKTLLSVFLSVFFLGSASMAQAVVVIDQVADSFTSGNFAIYGNNIASGTGQNYEVLKFKPQGNDTTGTAWDGSSLDQAPHGNILVGELYAHLNSNGITSTNKLGFGFDVNQNTQFVDIDSLVIQIYKGSVVDQTFSLADQVRVYDGISGNGSSTAEARFIINVGNDFMTRYAATDEFVITATHSGANGGFEEYFLSSVYSRGDQPTPTPEPASMALFGMGLAGLGFLRRKQFKA